MVNYIKSEWYRITRGKEIYLTIAVLSALTVAMNTVLYVVGQGDENFPYATIRFSFSTLISLLPYLFVAGALVSAFLFAEEKKNGTLKNNIAYGISRESIFVGKCIVCIASSIICMIIVLAVFIGSAFLLLEGSGAEPLLIMLKGVGAALPSTIGSIVFAVLVLSMCSSEMISVVWWVAVIFVIPSVCFNIGRRVELFKVIADWIPTIFLSNEVTINMSGYDCLWDTSFGLTKCMVAGFGSIIIFMLVGIWSFRKKEV